MIEFMIRGFSMSEEQLLHKWEFLSSIPSACAKLGEWVLTEYLFIDQKFQAQRMEKRIESLYEEYFEKYKNYGMR